MQSKCFLQVPFKKKEPHIFGTTLNHDGWMDTSIVAIRDKIAMYPGSELQNISQFLLCLGVVHHQQDCDGKNGRSFQHKPINTALATVTR
mmetsp:Transcript_20456/g.32911  ORF Transcript_20456/g.32911 Transcript_20456/m.32911 type:complete len:90 (-) Transcript_20456:55-324(-)